MIALNLWSKNLLPEHLNRFRVKKPKGSADSLLIADMHHQHQRKTVILTQFARDAQRIHAELQFLNPNLRIKYFPDWETLPYDHFSPHQDLVSERLATLYEIYYKKFDIIIAPITTILQRLAPVDFLESYAFFIKKNDEVCQNDLTDQLIKAGYDLVKQVLRPGEFSKRGGIVDLFPMGSDIPYRLDFFDNEIESIRTFDVESQRSLDQIKEIRLLPAHEFPTDENAISCFLKQFKDYFPTVDHSKVNICQDLNRGLLTGGIEYYLPLFFNQVSTLFDYLPKDSLFILHQDVQNAMNAFWDTTQKRYDMVQHDVLRPVLAPDKLFIFEHEFFNMLKDYQRIEMSELLDDANKYFSIEMEDIPIVQIDRHHTNPTQLLKQFINVSKQPILLSADSLGRRENLASILFESKINYKKLDDIQEISNFLQEKTEEVGLIHSPLETGFVLNQQVAILTEQELYGDLVKTARIKRERKKFGASISTDTMVRNLNEIKSGDLVVHERYGIGRYLGLENIDLGDGISEYLSLEFAEQQKLYMPISQLYLINQYAYLNVDDVKLNNLYNISAWEKTKQKALQKIRDTAVELLDLYAKRSLRVGHEFQLDLQDYQTFIDEFGFEETEDQLKAIQSVIDDMTSPKPMDRLICGDVGFGKTEVALRASFIAVMNNKQVALLVPTTLLADQHYQLFSERFSKYPVRIEELSRFRTAKEQKKIIEELKDGKIDIIIGTHRLIQKDVEFANLGLLMIDEEHRFGVRQKEQLKRLRTEVDALALTATPIPRTLSMALEGVRDFSMITTAPQKRLSVKTFVSQYNETVIREAILRELKRGGQIYFLHNEINSIYTMQDNLSKLVPEARIEVGHGQLNERELEHIMRDFYQQRFNILLCTTIIENGIDIPSANTIIINQADHLGLAQLHQLRGRVGRSHHQAYAYLFVDEDLNKLNDKAQKRLIAIESSSTLGSGFNLAVHDMEIRGAGEILGDSQSGDMMTLGFQLYSDLLNQMIKKLKNGEEIDLSQPFEMKTEINLHVSALLPDFYCEDIQERLVIYKRLSSIESLEDLNQFEVELIDRFGLLPQPTEYLLLTHKFRIKTKAYDITHLDLHPKAITIQFKPNARIDPMSLIQWVQTNPKYKFANPTTLKLVEDIANVDDRIQRVNSLLAYLRRS